MAVNLPASFAPTQPLRIRAWLSTPPRTANRKREQCVAALPENPGIDNVVQFGKLKKYRGHGEDPKEGQVRLSDWVVGGESFRLRISTRRRDPSRADWADQRGHRTAIPTMGELSRKRM
jgi:hypothetical protein